MKNIAVKIYYEIKELFEKLLVSADVMKVSNFFYFAFTFSSCLVNIINMVNYQLLSIAFF
jgi:hypothetical protein